MLARATVAGAAAAVAAAAVATASFQRRVATALQCGSCCSSVQATARRGCSSTAPPSVMAAATSAAADSDAASAAAAATTAERDARANSMLVLHTEIGLMLQRSAADDGGACDLTGTMLANTAGQLRPYEASCIEVQSESTAPSCTTITSRWNTTAIGGAANLADKNAAEDTPGVGAAQQQQPSTGGVAQQRKRPAAEKRFFVVLYYETHTADGLLAFRSIAARVAAKQLPGETVNRMAFGFAMWRVPAADFQELMATPRLASS